MKEKIIKVMNKPVVQYVMGSMVTVLGMCIAYEAGQIKGCNTLLNVIQDVDVDLRRQVDYTIEKYISK